MPQQGVDKELPRIRTIKPEFFSSPDIKSMSFAARLLYIAMWNWADDYGRGTAELRELMGFAFPRDQITLDEFRGFLGEVHRGFDVAFYTVRGRTYYEIPTWDFHQKVDKRSKPKYPSPSEGEPCDPETPPEQGTQSDVRGSHRALDGNRRHLDAGTGEQGNRGTSTLTCAAEPSSARRPKSAESSTGSTENKIAQELTKVYCDRVPLSNFPAVMRIVRKARKSGRYSDEEIHTALARLAEDSRSVTTDTLRTELDGFPAYRPTTDAKVEEFARRFGVFETVR